MIEQFFRPDSVEQALELKRRYQDEAVWFAGGSKLNATPTRTDKKIAISLQDLELDWVDWDNGALRIGAMSRLQPLRDARFIPAALREALGFVYSRHVRNQSTIGGEIAARQHVERGLHLLAVERLLHGLREETPGGPARRDHGPDDGAALQQAAQVEGAGEAAARLPTGTAHATGKRNAFAHTGVEAAQRTAGHVAETYRVFYNVHAAS